LILELSDKVGEGVNWLIRLASILDGVGRTIYCLL